MSPFRLFISLSISATITALVLVLCSCSMFEIDRGKDESPPRLTLKGNNPDTIYARSTYSDPGCTAKDLRDGDISSSVEVDYGSLDTLEAGEGFYTVLYSISDKAGNYNDIARKVVVIDTEKITISNDSLVSCPIIFDDTTVVYTIKSNLTISSYCKVTFGPRTEYVVKGSIIIVNGGTLTIEEGVKLSFADNTSISVGENGTLKTNGSEDDSIRFTNLDAGTRWGSGLSSSSAGGIIISDGAVGCSLSYCVIDSAINGIYVKNSEISLNNSHIYGNKYFGCYFSDGGTPVDSAHFIDNVVTGNDQYGIGIYANFVGALSGTGSFTGNSEGGILIKEDNVENDAFWKKHDADYIVEGNIDIGSVNGATVTILPGVKFQCRENAFFSIGVSGEGTIIANGTVDDSIHFINYSAGTRWGYGTSAAASGAFLIDDEATSKCSFSYCCIDSATSGMYIRSATAGISNCRISGNRWYGIYCADEGAPTDSARFIDNTITGNGEFGISIYANFAGMLSGTGSFTGNNKGAILIMSDVVENDAIWKKHDAPYVVDGNIDVGSESSPRVTIRPGCQFAMKDNAYFSIGKSKNGTIIANGVESDSIQFTNYSDGTHWGYGTSPTSSGGFLLGNAATAHCSFSYCTIDNATSGLNIGSAVAGILHCCITDNQWNGIYFTDNGYPADSASFTNNVITDNGEFGVCIYANFAGKLSGTGTFTGNSKGAILVKEDKVENDAVWKKHDEPYVIEGNIAIEAENGVLLRIRPGAVFKMKDEAFFTVGASKEGTLIAEGTANDSIEFLQYSSGTKWGYGTSATASGGLWIDDKATASTSLKYCSISEATTGIYVGGADPIIQRCSMTNCEYYGMYLNDSPATKIANNTYSGNGTGDVETNK